MSRVHVLAALALVAVGGGLWFALDGLGLIDQNESLRSELEAEFDDAYPEAPAGGGELVEISLVAAPSTVELVEGSATDVWAYNDLVPGPAIRATLGDTIRATLHNELSEPTTIHWHGIRVPNNMDGVPELSQAPVEPGQSFVYEFTPPDAGTYWYHSHVNGSEQLERGLYGTLVIEQPQSQVDYDNDITWLIDDWLLIEDNQLDPAFNTPDDRGHNGRWGDIATVNSSLSETIRAQPGERLRLRLINASNGRVYRMDFGELTPKVIAVDGLATSRPIDPGELNLAPGNRLDLDLSVPENPGTYAVSDVYLGMSRQLATIVVEGPTTGDVNVEVAGHSAVPDWSGALDAPVDIELAFETQSVDDDWIWTINGDQFPDGQPLELDHGRFTKIKLVNLSHPLHPIHLHGQFFKVLTRNGEPVDEPNFRDTVLLEARETVEIGLIPLDRGEWLLHCHIQEHADAGMMTSVIVS